MLEIALIVFGITAAIGITLGLYLSNVCTRVSDDEEYESNNYADNYRGRYQGDDKAMTREQRIEHYMMSNRRNLAELMVHREDEYKETLKTQYDLMVSGEKRGVDKATEDSQSRICENCKWLDRKPPQHEHDSWKNTCMNEDSAMWLESPSFTFGCNEFSCKDE